ncbi:MAG TPA: TonB-dependent receptor, partial [Xanthomonadales bacterium]|nr:TonB-dependent receptor [Xanthomonadales bacterium]
EGASNFSLSDTFHMRASLKYQERDEWIDNTVNGPGDDFGGFDEFAWRLSAQWEPSDSFTGYFNLHGFNQDGSDPNVFYANAIALGTSGVRPEFNPKIASNDNQVHDLTLDAFGGVMNLQWLFNNGMTFTSITGYDTVENFQSADVDGGETSFNPADIGKLGKQVFFGVATGDGLDDLEQFTQEFRLSAQANDQLFWQTGLYYFDEDFDLLNYDFLNVPASALVSQQTTSWAVFGQAEYSFTDTWALTVGARWTDDDKDLQVRSAFPGGTVGADDIAVSDSFFNWDLALNWDASEDWTWYARIATGSRGPVTLGRFGFVSSADTEDTLSTEIGFKSMLAEDRVRWNTSLYSFRNDDQQLTATGGAGNINQLLNAEHVNGYGMETELDWQATENLFLSANASYTHTEIDDPGLKDDLCGSAPTCTGLDPIAGMRIGPFGPVTEVFIDGNPLPRTPEWIFNLIAEYSYPISNGELYFNTDWNYRDKSNLFLHESVEFVQDARWLGGLRTGYRTNSGMDFALVGRNITDEVVVEGGINFLNLTAFVNDPAYWGVEFMTRF